MSRTWKAVFVLFIFLIIVSAGVYIWQISNSQQNSGVVMQPSVQIPAFKTYSNKSFTAQYPNSYDVTEDKNGIVTIAGPNGKIMIGDFDFAAAEPAVEMSQTQKDQFPKDIKYHGFDGRVASALFYATGDDATMRDLKSIQDTIITTLVVTKNYVSTKDIFSFDYPTGWVVAEDASTIDVYLASSTLRSNYFSISKLSSRFSPEPLQYYIDNRNLKKTDLLIGGSDVYADGVTSTEKDALGYYLFSNRDNVYQIYCQYNLPEVKSIIASIKFPPADPANKIVYRNDQYKFSLELPDAWLSYQVVQEDGVGDNKITLLRFNLNSEQIFTIGIFKVDEFANVDPIKNPAVYNSKIAENGSFVFTAIASQDVSKYMAPRLQDVAEILKSFKPY